MTMKRIGAVAALMCAGVVAGCSGGSSSSTPAATTSVSGRVADGYLENAQVFLDKNTNYKWDAGEPQATTKPDGSFTLTIDAADVGRYPIVAVAIKDTTIDHDDTTAAVSDTYVLSMHAVAVNQSGTTTTGTVANFISPISTMLRETMEANPGMNLAQAMTKVRNQLNLSTDINMMEDYIAGSRAGSHMADFTKMHDTAHQMAGLMQAQAAQVMNGNTPDVGRYRGMMTVLDENLQDVAYNAAQHQGMNSATMQTISNRMHDTISGMAAGTFKTYSSMFRNMTSVRSFWNMSGGMMKPKQRM